MSKNSKNGKFNPLMIIGDKVDPVKLVNDFVGKKGRIGKKGNKDQKKFMRGICSHHRISKRGIPKPAVWKNADETATCKMCGKTMSTVPYERHEIKKAIDKIAFINEQLKFLATACCTKNKKLINFFASFGVLAEFYPKNAKNLSKVAETQNRNAKSKKKRKGIAASTEYGTWGTRR